MSELEQREWMIPLSYAECDAAFAAFLPELRRGGITFERLYRAATAGSASYSLKINLTGTESPLGTIRLRQIDADRKIDADRTLARVAPPARAVDGKALIPALNGVLRGFWRWYQEEPSRLKQIPPITDLTEDLERALRSAPPQLTEPKRGDSMDAWLDWRDREQQRTGHRSRFTSLTHIAKEGGFKIDSLKKKSAERRRKQAEENEGSAE